MGLGRCFLGAGLGPEVWWSHCHGAEDWGKLWVCFGVRMLPHAIPVCRGERGGLVWVLYMWQRP